MDNSVVRFWQHNTFGEKLKGHSMSSSSCGASFTNFLSSKLFIYTFVHFLSRVKCFYNKRVAKRNVCYGWQLWLRYWGIFVPCLSLISIWSYVVQSTKETGNMYTYFDWLNYLFNLFPFKKLTSLIAPPYPY